MEHHRRQRRNGNIDRSIRCGAVVAALAFSLLASLVWAGTITKVRTLLANPESYQLKTVLVTGVVTDHQVKHIKRWVTGVDRCIQTFTVKDDTGSMQAAYGASCSGALDLLRNRDRVTLEARFEWAPGKQGVLDVQSVLSKVAPYP